VDEAGSLNLSEENLPRLNAMKGLRRTITYIMINLVIT
jgi:hypothetical protein